MKKKITFKSKGYNLVGDLYWPADVSLDNNLPAIVVSGSWTTVKEQMAAVYAAGFAKRGLVALAFDFRNFGESEGEPRFYESPALKSEDIQSAVTYLASLPSVNSEQLAVFGVCAGAMYSLMAAAKDARIKAVVTAASWLHDAEAVKLFYGGEEGVMAKIKTAREAKAAYAAGKEVAYIPTISETDASAAMYGPFDYYLNSARGAIKEWSGDKFAVASWEDWLTADPMITAKDINVPLLMIHSDGAVLPDYTKKYFANVATDDKKLHWIATEMESPLHQFNFYDQLAEVNEVLKEGATWFNEKLISSQ